MKRYPLKEMKELQNEVMRKNHLKGVDISKITNYSQFQIIKTLIDASDKGNEVYQKDLEKILNIRKSTLSGILDTMEKNMIINRVQTSKGNKIELTNETLMCKNDVIAQLNKMEAQLIRGIDPQELEIFFKVIDKMKSNLKGDVK